MNSRICSSERVINVAGTQSGQLGIVAGIQRWWRVERSFRKTYNELSALTERELNDLGIARADISRIARDAAEKAS